MKPFIDKSIAKIERSLTIVIGAPSDDTITFDPYRQGIEVSRINYFLRSNLPFVSSKGINRRSPNELIDHELDANNMGQGLNLDGFMPFDDQMEFKKASDVLIHNVIQSDDDPYFGRAAQDGEIDIFSDTGKRSARIESPYTRSKGIRASIEAYGGLFRFKGLTKNWFLDAADSSLGVITQGYVGNDVSLSPFVDSIEKNSFGTQLEYQYIGPDEKSPAAGYDYYGSSAGTDSVAYGGCLR